MEAKVLNEAIRLINEENYACVLIKDGVIKQCESGRGIGPVFTLYDNGELKDAAIVDKVIGKAAAMIMTDGGVSEAYGIIASKDAVNWFNDYSIPFNADTVTEVILNRTNTGMCPMELTVHGINSAVEGLPALRNKIAELKRIADRG